MKNGAIHTPLNHLRKDLHAVARDAEALLKATADITGERVQEARARTERTVRQAYDHLYDDRLHRRVRKAVRTTDAYIREHSWGVIGAAVGVGLLIGLLARRD
jgi:ElaB/YqjD/DUF883 family membrane-anchored ribosome-binding protein